MGHATLIWLHIFLEPVEYIFVCNSEREIDVTTTDIPISDVAQCLVQHIIAEGDESKVNIPQKYFLL